MRPCELVVVGLAFAFFPGCANDAIRTSATSAPGNTAAPVPTVATRGAQSPAGPAAEPPNLPPLPSRSPTNDDFTESAHNRDPFRSYETPQVVIPPTQRDILAADYAIEELSVKGMASEKALIDDPSGFAWIVKVGDYVGKPDTVTSPSSGATLPAGWRVDAIRDNDIVFVRENPFDPVGASAPTKTLALRTAAELNAHLRTRGRGARG